MLFDALPASVVLVEDVVARAVEDLEILFSEERNDELTILKRLFVVFVEPWVRRERVMVANIFGSR